MSFHKSLRHARLGCFLLVPLVASCGSGFGSLASTNSTPTASGQTDNTQTPLPAQVSDPVVEIAAVTPPCCDPLERDFEVTIDGNAPPAGAICQWDFGDHQTGAGCTVTHRYTHRDVYDVTVTVTLLDGEDLTSAVELDLSSQAPTTGSDGKTLNVDAGEDFDALPGLRVRLKGTVTTDMDPVDLVLKWTQVRGPTVKILDDARAYTWVELPEDMPAESLVFQLTATADNVEASDTVTVNVAPVEGTPTEGDNVVTFVPGDATDAIQEMIDSGLPTVVIPNVGQPWIVRPLFLRSDLHLTLEPGVVLEAKPGAYPQADDSVLSGFEVMNVVIDAYGATIRMPKDEYIPPFKYANYVDGEWRHAVNLRGVTNVDVLGLHVDGTGGAGIYISPTWTKARIQSRNVTIRDCAVENSYRNGICTVSVENLLIDGCAVRGTQGRHPQSGIHFETEDPRDRLINVVVSNTVAYDNEGSGVVVNIHELTDASEPVSVTIRNCHMSNSHQPTLRLSGSVNGSPGGLIEFDQVQVDNAMYPGAWGLWDPAGRTKVRFKDCLWRNVGLYGYLAPISFDVMDSQSSGTAGGIEFVNCLLYDRFDRDPFELTSDTTLDARYDISGNIRVINSATNRTDVWSTPLCPDLLFDFATSADGP